MTSLKEELETVSIITAGEPPASADTVEMDLQADSSKQNNEGHTDLSVPWQDKQINSGMDLNDDRDGSETTVEMQNKVAEETKKQRLRDNSLQGIRVLWVFTGVLIGLLVSRLAIYLATHFSFCQNLFQSFHSSNYNLLLLLVQVGCPIAGALLALRLTVGFAKDSASGTFQALIAAELDRHKLPLFVLLILLSFPKLIILWIPLALCWSGIEWLLPKLPTAARLKLQKTVPESWRQSALLRELSDGIAQARPFIIFPLFIACIPIAVIWMSAHWLKKIAGLTKEEEPEAPVQANADLLSFVQNHRRDQEESESNFYHSPAFGITCVSLFACGLPAFLTFLLYQHLGIDAMLGFPSADPHFQRQFFSVHLYLCSLGCCLSILFIRSWFTFPLNFVGNECRIDMDSNGIRRRMNSWFTQVLTFNSPYSGADRLSWQEIKCIRAAQHCPRL